MLPTTPQARRIPLSRRSHIIGFQWTPSGATAHESALERDFVTLTSFIKPAATILSQPVTIFFEDCGCRRRYTPDYLVRDAGSAELVEVKYKSDLVAHGETLAPAFSAAEEWSQAHEARFRIATESDIRGRLLDNARRLLPLRALPLDVRTAMLARTHAHHLKQPTFGELLELLPDRKLALATIWRLIARGELLTDFSLPITFDSVLYPK